MSDIKQPGEKCQTCYHQEKDVRSNPCHGCLNSREGYPAYIKRKDKKDAADG